MYERIQGTGKFTKVDKGSGNVHQVERFDIYDAQMREVLTTVVGMDAAIQWLEQETRRERIACPTGSCED